MVSINGIKNSFSTTQNFWDAFLLKINSQRRKIHFKNGLAIKLNWTEYCRLRDWFISLDKQSFTIKKEKGKYLFQRTNPKFSYSSNSLRDIYYFSKAIMLLVSRKWDLEQVSDSCYKIQRENASYTIRKLENNLIEMQSDNLKMVGPSDILIVFFNECESYDCDFRNKTVLDVGGYCGETAVYFWSRGAKKIIIYEPITSHHEFIHKNIALNNICAECHEEGIGKDDRGERIRYEVEDQEFGLLKKGKKERRIRLKNITNVLIESAAEIAKFDCEGAEQCLVDVPEEVLGRIKFYIIETHSETIRKKIEEKFANSGFKMTRIPRDIAEGVSILCFEKNNNSLN